MNLAALTKEELEQLMNDIPAALKRLEVLNQIKALADSIGEKVIVCNTQAVTTVSTTQPKLSRVGTPIKYRDLDDATKVWTGNGTMPQWLKERIGEGWNREDFLDADYKPKITEYTFNSGNPFAKPTINEETK